ncbi:MAG: extracellular solute-binding protein [Dehalococcoidia bacterium]
MTRRGFLHTVAVGSAGVAGFVLIGCGPGDETGDGAPTATGTGTAGGTGATGGTGAAGAPDATPTQAAEIGAADVLGIWGEEELTSFEAMVAGWQEATGGQVNFTGTRDVTAVLTTRVEGGTPPDIAIPAEVGLFQQFAQEGLLIPLSAFGLDDVIQQNYPTAFVDLGSVDGQLYGFFMKADSKGTVWYNPRLFQEHGWEPLTADSTWDDLVALSEQIRDSGVVPPWSIGIESDATSGWPATDWVQQILLNEHGGDVYDGIIDGSVPFTDDSMRDAWEKFGTIALGEGMTAQGGATGINATNFGDATPVPFGPEPGAAMTYLGAFASGIITEQYPDLVAGEDYDFFPFPGGGVTGGANIVYAFNDDETTGSLLEHLASAEAQSVWVEAGGFTSVNEHVQLESYPDDVSRKVAEQLRDAEVFRFDLDDAIGGNLQQTMFTGITQYLQDPGALDQILQDIEAARGV